MKAIKQHLNTALLTVKKIADAWKLRRIIKQAERLHKQGKGQQFVVNVGGKATIVSKQQFKDMRQNGLFQLSYTAKELRNIAIYTSPR